MLHLLYISRLFHNELIGNLNNNLNQYLLMNGTEKYCLAEKMLLTNTQRLALKK
jgi:hypothetical protein